MSRENLPGNSGEKREKRETAESTETGKTGKMSLDISRLSRCTGKIPTEGVAMVTAWVGGAFVSVEQPEWWGEETDRLYPLNGPVVRHDFMLGCEFAFSVEAYRMPGRGWLVEMIPPSGDLLSVWCPADAALLDLMTTRAAAWCALGGLLK